jgi:hypothetical protein
MIAAVGAADGFSIFQQCVVHDTGGTDLDLPRRAYSNERQFLFYLCSISVDLVDGD